MFHKEYVFFAIFMPTLFVSVRSVKFTFPILLRILPRGVTSKKHKGLLRILWRRGRWRWIEAATPPQKQAIIEMYRKTTKNDILLLKVGLKCLRKSLSRQVFVSNVYLFRHIALFILLSWKNIILNVSGRKYFKQAIWKVLNRICS